MKHRSITLDSLEYSGQQAQVLARKFGYVPGRKYGIEVFTRKCRDCGGTFGDDHLDTRCLRRNDKEDSDAR
jgi:hypothetical protein